MREDTYKMPSYYGDSRVERGRHAGSDRADLASVVGATLVGVDKSDQDGIDYVDMLRTFYRPSLGSRRTNQSSRRPRRARPTTMSVTATGTRPPPTSLYFMLGAQYPNATDMARILRSIADAFCDQVAALGGASADFDGQGFDFSTRTKNAGDRNEGGDGAAGTAAIELWAYARRRGEVPRGREVVDGLSRALELESR